jgi:hypothetical protein
MAALFLLAKDKRLKAKVNGQKSKKIVENFSVNGSFFYNKNYIFVV